MSTPHFSIEAAAALKLLNSKLLILSAATNPEFEKGFVDAKETARKMAIECYVMVQRLLRVDADDLPTTMSSVVVPPVTAALQLGDRCPNCMNGALVQDPNWDDKMVCPKCQFNWLVKA